MGCFSFGDHDKERIASNHAIHFLYGHVQFAGDDTLHLFRLVPMLVANLSAFFMIACNLQVGRIFMGIRISVLQRSENVRVDKGRVENMKKKKRLSQNETAFFCVCKKIGQVLTSLSQNLPVSLIFCILGNQVKISQR